MVLACQEVQEHRHVKTNIETILKELELWRKLSIQKLYNHIPIHSAFLEVSREFFLEIQLLNCYQVLNSLFGKYFPVSDKNTNRIAHRF